MKSTYFILTFIIGCLSLGFLSPFHPMENQPDPNLYVYLCFGQSNMEGSAAVEPQDTPENERFKVMQSSDCPNLNRKLGEIYPAVPPLSHCYAGLSPADYFGRTLVKELPDSVRVLVIVTAVGGCDIRLFDKDLYTDHDSTYMEDWFQDKVKAYGGNPYERLRSLAQKAQQQGVIKGMILHQGETNNGDKNWPSYVKKVYGDLITDLELDAASVPLIAGEVVHADQQGLLAGMNNIIDRLPEVLPNGHVVSSSGCSVQEDRVHFDSEGVRELGRRYAHKMLEVQGE